MGTRTSYDFESFKRWYEEENGRIEVRKIVCPACDGNGRYVNPAIDSHGLSTQDFAEDPDFEEGYFTGRYDIVCEYCDGQNVVDEPVDEQVQKAWQDQKNEEAADRRTQWFEMGCPE